MGLRRFDGSPCYEHADPRRSEMAQWGTMMFDYARGEVCSFLLSNACFWLEYYHVDGLRCDAVSAMIYHDFSRDSDAWLPNIHGGRENLEAIAFIRRLNETVYHDFPGVMIVAEESTAFPMVTAPTYLGGLGFGFKWNMGWMNDMLSYTKLDHIYRRYHHDKLTFSLHYAFSENYIPPFSHDEVVHGKHSMLDKQPGDLWRKFAGLRALYGYTMAHPGKKLLFMGGEFGHFIEWKDDDQLDWFLLVYERHPDMQRYVKALNRFYLDHPAFWEVDDGWDGFQWLEANDTRNSVVIFARYDRKGRAIICAANFTLAFTRYRVGRPMTGDRGGAEPDLSEYGGPTSTTPARCAREESTTTCPGRWIFRRRRWLRYTSYQERNEGNQEERPMPQKKMCCDAAGRRSGQWGSSPGRPPSRHPLAASTASLTSRSATAPTPTSTWWAC